MEPLDPESVQRFWLAAARSLAWRRNFAYWCDRIAPIFIAVSALAAIALLVLRLLGHPTTIAWLILAIGLILGGVVAVISVWRKRVTRLEALSCLDEIARLHNRLVSAHAGVGQWPPAQPYARDTTLWNGERLATPLLVVGAILFAASQAPRLEARQKNAAIEEPMAWTQVDSWLRTLDETKLADQQTLAALEEQLNELRQKPAEEWYDQNGLEAGDALRQRLEQGLKEMRTALEQGSKAVNAAQQLNQTSSLSEMQGVSSSLQQALQGLKVGNLPANPELQERLQKAGSGNPKQMTAQQAAELQQRMTEGMQTIDRCVAPQIVKGKSRNKPGEEQEGSGGPGGGGKSQPVGLNEQATNLQTQRLETSVNDEMSRALPGDLIAVTSGSQDIDRNAPFNTQSGGKVSPIGNGGDAVWRDSVTPDERQVLERYFK